MEDVEDRSDGEKRASLRGTALAVGTMALFFAATWVGFLLIMLGRR